MTFAAPAPMTALRDHGLEIEITEAGITPSLDLEKSPETKERHTSRPAKLLSLPP